MPTAYGNKSVPKTMMIEIVGVNLLCLALPKTANAIGAAFSGSML
jgi:hypothetical protein